jgi:hypothetical protein
MADHGKLSGGEIADRMMSLVVCLTNASRNGVLR